MECLGVMVSTHRHDFVRCECGQSFLDGGNDYFKAGGHTVGVNEDYEEGMTAQEFMDYLENREQE